MQEFSDTMVGVVICKDVEDRWVWGIGIDSFYSVKSAYDHLVSQRVTPKNSRLFSGITGKVVPPAR